MKRGKCSPQYFSQQDYILFLSDAWKISIWKVEFLQPSLHSAARIVIIGSPEAEVERLKYLNEPSFFIDSLQLCGLCR